VHTRSGHLSGKIERRFRTMGAKDCSAFESLLYDFSDGLLDGDEYVAVEEHCKECSSCSAIVAEIKAVTSAVDAYPELEPPAEKMWTALSQRIADDRAVETQTLPSFLTVFLTKIKRFRHVALPALVTAIVLLGVFPVWFPTNVAQLPKDPVEAASKILDSRALVQESVSEIISDASSEARWNMLEDAFGEVTLDDVTSDMVYDWK
jgi:anti-sigma factor RsiW